MKISNVSEKVIQKFKAREELSWYLKGGGQMESFICENIEPFKVNTTDNHI